MGSTGRNRRKSLSLICEKNRTVAVLLIALVSLILNPITANADNLFEESLLSHCFSFSFALSLTYLLLPSINRSTVSL